MKAKSKTRKIVEIIFAVAVCSYLIGYTIKHKEILPTIAAIFVAIDAADIGDDGD